MAVCGGDHLSWKVYFHVLRPRGGRVVTVDTGSRRQPWRQEKEGVRVVTTRELRGTPLRVPSSLDPFPSPITPRISLVDTPRPFVPFGQSSAMQCVRRAPCPHDLCAPRCVVARDWPRTRARGPRPRRQRGAGYLIMTSDDARTPLCPRRHPLAGTSAAVASPSEALRVRLRHPAHARLHRGLERAGRSTLVAPGFGCYECADTRSIGRSFHAAATICTTLTFCFDYTPAMLSSGLFLCVRPSRFCVFASLASTLIYLQALAFPPPPLPLSFITAYPFFPSSLRPIIIITTTPPLSCRRKRKLALGL